VKFYGPFRYLELRCDFLVREILNNAVQHILLAAADSNSCPQRTPRFQELVNALDNRLKQGFPSDDHQLEIFGLLYPNKAMYREQTSHFLNGHASIRISLDAKSQCARRALA
jgi:hypothetical protein